MPEEPIPDSAARTSRKRAYKRGIRAEWIAEAMLRLKGYRILARRYLAPGGEIDLIAKRGGVIAFVEVKHRSSLDSARTSITHQKRQRISRACRHWTARHPAAMSRVLRGDAVFLAPGCWPVHEENCFELGLG
ncbi:MAG: YraN family protein [Beijerinckiaceae bacterium]|mgnify:CR=1 FL=1|nr:YraN family protein [Beijerinckiaceae bacterium]